MIKYLRMATAMALIVIVFWWCVVFPEICGPVRDVQTGVSDTGEVCEDMEVRFWVWEFWGKIRNFFRRG
jgi:hypothetical protein